MNSCNVVDPLGTSGELALMFNNENVEVVSRTRNIIDIRYVCKEDTRRIRFTWVYRDCDFWQRQKLWDRLRAISAGVMEPWICLRDFNDIAIQHEKCGGSAKD